MDYIKFSMFNKIYHTFLSNPVKINPNVAEIFGPKALCSLSSDGKVTLTVIPAKARIQMFYPNLLRTYLLVHIFVPPEIVVSHRVNTFPFSVHYGCWG